MKASPKHDRIYAAVMAVPAGRVATYGQIARVAGLPGRARLVGFALRMLPEDTAVPWHRVVNAQGAISGRGRPENEHEQRLLLEYEGVEFDVRDRVELARFQWEIGRDLD